MRINADPKIGLSIEDVMDRRREGLSNIQVDASDVTIGQIIRNNVFTYFNLVFCLLAVCIILVGSFNDLMFMPVVIINTVIGIIQEIRSKKPSISFPLFQTRKPLLFVRERKSLLKISTLYLTIL